MTTLEQQQHLRTLMYFAKEGGVCWCAGMTVETPGGEIRLGGRHSGEWVVLSYSAASKMLRVIRRGECALILFPEVYTRVIMDIPGDDRYFYLHGSAE